MNADAYLKRHGWRGAGHSLDHTDRGIKKPLLIAHKQDQLGLGKKKAAHNVSDQWWMRAFDQSLQNIGTGQESTLTQVRRQGVNRGGLYSFFVKGEGLHGTIIDSSSPTETSQTPSSKSSPRESTPATTVSNPSEESSDTASDSSSTSDTESDLASESSEDCDTMTAGTSQLAEQGGSLANDCKKRKRVEKETPKEVQKRRRLERQEKVQRNKINNMAKGDMTGNDPLAERNAAVLRRIDREVKATIKTQTKRGEFDSILQTKCAEDDEHSDPKASQTGTKPQAKRAKYERETRARKAKKELRAKLVVDAMLSGDLPNPKNLSREDALQNVERELKAIQKESKPKRGKSIKRKKLERADAQTPQTKHLKETKGKAGGDKQQSKKAGDAKVEKKQSKRGKKSSTHAPQDGLAEGESTLDENVKQRESEVHSKIAGLSEQEKVHYEARAKEKSQSLEQYILRRIEKKDLKRAGKVQDTPEQEMPMFFTDLEGDSGMLAKVNRDTSESKPLSYTLNLDGSIPIDPVVWEGRQIKTLSKAERAARLQYLRKRRVDRKIAAGKVKPDEETPKSRGAKKAAALQRLTAKILSDEMGIPQGASKEQIALARSKAKRHIKEEKREVKKGGAKKLRDKKKTKMMVSDRAKERNRMVSLALSGETAI